MSPRNAEIAELSSDLVVQLRSALDAHRVVAQAVGILMDRSGEGESAARQQLASLSQDEGMVPVARTIVDEAVRRARTQPLG